MFKTRKFYTHKKMLDCAILVKGILPTSSLVVEWWVKRGFSLNRVDVINISSEELLNWFEIEL